MLKSSALSVTSGSAGSSSTMLGDSGQASSSASTVPAKARPEAKSAIHPAVAKAVDDAVEVLPDGTVNVNDLVIPAEQIVDALVHGAESDKLAKLLTQGTPQQDSDLVDPLAYASPDPSSASVTRSAADTAGTAEHFYIGEAKDKAASTKQ